MHIQRQSASRSSFSIAEIEVGSPGGIEASQPRAAWLQRFYDFDGKLKSDVLRGLTPGTAEFARLDATARRERGRAPHQAAFHHMNRRYVTDADPAYVPDQSLPAFDQGVLHSLRAFLQASPRNQAYIMEDDAGAEHLVRWYEHLCDVASRSPAAADQDPEKALVSTCDFEEELDRSFARLDAGRGGSALWDVGEKSNAIRKQRSAAPGRALASGQVEALKRSWSTLGGAIWLSPPGDSLQVCLSDTARVSIQSDHIAFVGLDTLDEAERLDTTRLAALHAREYWGASMTIRDAAPAGALRLIAFAELLGVSVVSCDIHVAREAVDNLKQQLLETYSRDGASMRNSRPSGVVARMRGRIGRMAGAALTR